MALIIKIDDIDYLALTDAINFDCPEQGHYALNLVIRDTNGNGVDLLLSSGDVAILQTLLKNGGE